MELSRSSWAALLIQAGADINARADFGDTDETTLQEAASCYDGALCELIVEAGAFLIDHGADVNAQPSGFSHRIAMVDWGEAHPEFVQLLIQRGARPPEPDKSEEKSAE